METNEAPIKRETDKDVEFTVAFLTEPSLGTPLFRHRLNVHCYTFILKPMLKHFIVVKTVP